MTVEAATPFTAASGAFSGTWLLVAIPLFSALVLLVGGRRTNKWGHYLGVAAPLASFVLSAAMLVDCTWAA